MTTRNWQNITDYMDTVGTSLKTFTFPKTQNFVNVTIRGNANVSYTIGSQSGTLTPGQSISVSEKITSFTLTAASGTQTVEVWATEDGTQKVEDDSSDSISGLAASLASIATNVNGRGINTLKPPTPMVAIKGDNITDDASAINAIITSVKNNGGGTVFIPVSVAVGSPIIIPSNVHVKGLGLQATVIKFIGASGNVVQMGDTNGTTDVSRASLEGVTIDGGTTATVGLFCRYLTNGTYLRDIEIKNCGVGVDLSKAWYAQFENVRVRDGITGNGWNITGVSDQVNSIDFIGCQAHTCGGVGFNIGITHGCTFISCQAEYCNNEGFAINGGGGLVLQDCYTEQVGLTMTNPASVSIGITTQVYGALLIGGFFTGHGGTGSATISIDKAYDVSIMGTQLEVLDPSNRPIYHIQTTANTQGVTAFPSFLSNAGTTNTTAGVTLFSKNSSAIFPNGVKTDTLTSNADSKVSTSNSSLAVKDGKNLLSYGANNTAFGYLTYNSTSGEYQMQTYNGTTYNTTPLHIFPTILNDALKTKAGSHAASYASVYVDLSTGKLYSF